MGFLAGLAAIGSAVVGAVKTVGTFIGGIAAKVGPFVTKIAQGFKGIIAKLPDLSTVGSVLQGVSDIVNPLCNLLGVEKDEEPEVIGAKAQQSDKTLADFDDKTELYLKHLKEDIELDKDKFEKMNAEEKLGCATVGLALETKAIEDKFGDVILSPECLVMLAKLQQGSEVVFTAKELISIINDLKAAGITNMNDVVDYLEGNGTSNRVKTGEALKNAVSHIELVENPEDFVEEMKQVIRQDGEK